ncbi:hypothetical protein C4N9_06165 [Pararhodobacter marinus]|uniref:SnoaL-like domain-containing protein n=1 Tax=Pararhodobacter marinus TaxID=2184063 RepID=A0A2U2CER8_9RHOB|nr:nuclear transport factor 2 family protein [Pararhodobacter marinus]PWE30274.1 hypothetical protein C4N9_06165 [Pararhodobacter marinus]
MSIELPDAIEAYFSADKKGNAQAIAEVFTQDATVTDEGNTYTGRDAIRQWMANASTQYTYTVDRPSRRPTSTGARFADLAS